MIKHSQSSNIRVVQRGKQWYVQEHTQMAGSKTIDPWMDIGKPRDSQQGAVRTMYIRVPLQRVVA